MKWFIAFFVFMALAGSASAHQYKGQEDIYVLYRGSPGFPDMRIHVATFDGNERGSYNRQNCEIAAQLFSSQPGVIVRYWCSEGQHKPRAGAKGPVD